MAATGSSGVTMLCVPSAYDVRDLKPYHTAERGRNEEYEEHNAFEGGWTYQSLDLAEEFAGEPVSEEEVQGDVDYEEYLRLRADVKAAVTSLSERLDKTVDEGGYQRIYIKGSSLWRMASDGMLSRR